MWPGLKLRDFVERGRFTRLSLRHLMLFYFAVTIPSVNSLETMASERRRTATIREVPG